MSTIGFVSGNGLVAEGKSVLSSEKAACDVVVVWKCEVVVVVVEESGVGRT